jgi:DNA-directed RNA polymerase subunit K/omega
MFLSRYEVARLIGLRALQLSEGADPKVSVDAERQSDMCYVAAVELYEGKLDACVVRGSECVHVSKARPSAELVCMLDSHDGMRRARF